MPRYILNSKGKSLLDFQSNLSVCSAPLNDAVEPHHPITCNSELLYEDDGTMRCSHASVPEDDTRARSCIDHSIAILLFEILEEQEGFPES